MDLLIGVGRTRNAYRAAGRTRVSEPDLMRGMGLWAHSRKRP
ncbi:hypothetical protein [Leucobacter chromiireducens]